MLYKPFADLKLSVLGMGNMRLPTAGEGGPIDREKARAVIERAYAFGINYFDTAYRYHGGESESFVGEVLRQYPRDTWYLASKMPGHMMNFKDGRLGFQGYLAGEKIESIAQIFEEQLEKCGVDYFDFYLLHNVCESSWDFYTNETLDVVGYLLEQKKRGRIRHLGLSSHGRADTIDRFLTKYEGCFEFVQIQLNYMDWTLQGAAEKYAVVTAHGLPVIVMEPCRGGRLAALPEAAERLLKAARPADSTASWAFRFLTSLPNVQVVLSGMTTLEQLEENAALFSKDDPTTAPENELLQKVVGILADTVPCTACRYCCEDCPQGLEIPKLIAMYNELRVDGMNLLRFNLGGMAPEALPAACIGCGACARACPQGIDIPGIMRDFASRLEKA